MLVADWGVDFCYLGFLHRVFLLNLVGLLDGLIVDFFCVFFEEFGIFIVLFGLDGDFLLV